MACSLQRLVMSSRQLLSSCSAYLSRTISKKFLAPSSETSGLVTESTSRLSTGLAASSYSLLRSLASPDSVAFLIAFSYSLSAGGLRVNRKVSSPDGSSPRLKSPFLNLSIGGSHLGLPLNLTPAKHCLSSKAASDLVTALSAA